MCTIEQSECRAAFVPVLIVLARRQVDPELVLQVFGPFLQFASTFTLGAESPLSVDEHPPQIFQLVAELHRVVPLLLKLQSKLIEVRRRRLADPSTVVCHSRSWTFTVLHVTDIGLQQQYHGRKLMTIDGKICK